MSETAEATTPTTLGISRWAAKQFGKAANVALNICVPAAWLQDEANKRHLVVRGFGIGEDNATPPAQLTEISAKFKTAETPAKRLGWGLSSVAAHVGWGIAAGVTSVVGVVVILASMVVTGVVLAPVAVLMIPVGVAEAANQVARGARYIKDGPATPAAAATEAPAGPADVTDAAEPAVEVTGVAAPEAATPETPATPQPRLVVLRQPSRTVERSIDL